MTECANAKRAKQVNIVKRKYVLIIAMEMVHVQRTKHAHVIQANRVIFVIKKVVINKKNVNHRGDIVTLDNVSALRVDMD